MQPYETGVRMGQPPNHLAAGSDLQSSLASLFSQSRVPSSHAVTELSPKSRRTGNDFQKLVERLMSRPAFDSRVRCGDQMRRREGSAIHWNAGVGQLGSIAALRLAVMAVRVWTRRINPFSLRGAGVWFPLRACLRHCWAERICDRECCHGSLYSG